MSSKEVYTDSMKQASREVDQVKRRIARKGHVQCHFISNTHWDREWRFSMQRTRYMLVYMMDMLLDILEKYPEYKSFHLDSQTIPLHDYLEIRPEKEALIKQYVKQDRICVGPWFCLPDEYSVAGESLIRNLLLGHKIARKFGNVSKTGYSPFSWGQISQMPQIYTGFGINFSAFYRGINTIVAPRSEFYWEGADGTKIVASRLGYRPRYNVWYVMQRPAYWNQQDVGNRLMSWTNGHGAFKMVDVKHHLLDAQYAHPKFDYYQETMDERAKQAIEEQDNDWTTLHRFWSCGHDSSCPDIREIQMIQDANRVLMGKAEIFHSTFMDFQRGLCENIRRDLPVLKGEMRHLQTDMSGSPLFGWISSARMDIKKDNFETERDLTAYAEPLTVFASMLGAGYPQGFIDVAYNWLLQNHGHDSIGGCSRDIISEDMFFRSRQAREIAACLSETAMKEIAGSIKINTDRFGHVALVVYNPAPFERTELAEAYVQVLADWDCETIKIVDETGREIPFQTLQTQAPFYQIVQSPNDCANMFGMKRFHITVQFNNVPAMGYRTFFVKPVETLRHMTKQSLVTSAQTMENEFFSVKIESNGTLTIYNKATGKITKNMGYFKDSSEIGNPWQHEPVKNDSVFTTLNEKARITLIRDNELEASYEILLDWMLPACRTQDDMERGKTLNHYPVKNIVTVRRHQPWIDIQTEIDNTAEDHYLRVCFPTKIDTDKIWVQGQFDVVERSLEPVDYSQFDEAPQTEQPMNSFIDMSDGKEGLAFLNEGLKAYEVKNDPEKTVNLTLLRCFPLRICVTQEMTDYSKIDKSSQCLGKHTFHYGIMPHEGDWETAGLWQCSERFNMPFLIGQISPTGHGTEPSVKSFLEIEDDYLHVSAVKRSEDGAGWIIRLFNPFTRSIKTKIRLNQGMANNQPVQSPVDRIKAALALPAGLNQKWTNVQEVTLEETPVKHLQLDKNGWVDIEMAPKKILTVKFQA